MKLNKNLKKLICFIPFLLLVACTEPTKHHSIMRGFYHWKTSLQLDTQENQWLEKLHIEKLYVHFFDIDYDFTLRQAIPKGVVSIVSVPKQKIIPTVFITNRTIQQLNDAEIRILAQNILLKINALCQEKRIDYQEIQIDCDWSKTTKSRYFLLLHSLKKRLSKNTALSATIRLHQIKFADITGIPPVDRGLLMCYNVDDWRNEQTRNSIFDAQVVEKYIHDFEHYQIPLDLAMPVFSQTIVYRNHHFLVFLNNKADEDLKKANFLENTSKTHTFIAKKDTLIWGFSFRKGDIFRAESPDFEGQTMIAQRLIKHFDNDSINFLLYHLDSSILAPFTHEKLENLYPKNH